MKFPKEIFIIVPAKKKSQRLVNKNIKKFNNKYLIEYTLNFINKIGVGKQACVSTDSGLIKKISQKYRIKTITRPKKISNSKSKIEDAVAHSLKNIN
jgi:CMP-N-acetylneuraminic acid synthetase